MTTEEYHNERLKRLAKKVFRLHTDVAQRSIKIGTLRYSDGSEEPIVMPSGAVQTLKTAWAFGQLSLDEGAYVLSILRKFWAIDPVGDGDFYNVTASDAKKMLEIFRIVVELVHEDTANVPSYQLLAWPGKILEAVHGGDENSGFFDAVWFSDYEGDGLQFFNLDGDETLYLYWMESRGYARLSPDSWSTFLPPEDAAKVGWGRLSDIAVARTFKRLIPGEPKSDMTVMLTVDSFEDIIPCSIPVMHYPGRATIFAGRLVPFEPSPEFSCIHGTQKIPAHSVVPKQVFLVSDVIPYSEELLHEKGRPTHPKPGL